VRDLRMSREIRINESVKKLANVYEKISAVSNEINLNLNNLDKNLDWKIPQKDKINNDIRILKKNIQSFEKLNLQIVKYINYTVEIFKDTDIKMANKLNIANESVMNKNSETQKVNQENPAFDENGNYGGDQGSPRNNYDEVVEVVKKYNPDMSEEEVREYLEKLNHEGCGYVAMTNTIFDEYDGKEKEFEDKFGFPMYNENGELNHNLLVTDFYCATDNHNKEGWWIFSEDTVDSNEDFEYNDDTGEYEEVGKGTTQEDREYRWEMYCKDHNVEVDVTNNVEVTPENYNEISKDGDVVISAGYFDLIDEKGNVHHYDGGHAMTVTGVTEDGKYIVSSWGEKYYLDPDTQYFMSEDSDDNYYRNFQVVKY
jgi:hypothetical protein